MVSYSVNENKILFCRKIRNKLKIKQCQKSEFFKCGRLFKTELSVEFMIHLTILLSLIMLEEKNIFPEGTFESCLIFLKNIHVFIFQY
jgi:hypothetical protein